MDVTLATHVQGMKRKTRRRKTRRRKTNLSDSNSDLRSVWNRIGLVTSNRIDIWLTG